MYISNQITTNLRHLFILKKALVAVAQFQTVVTDAGLTFQSFRINFLSQTVRLEVLAPHPSTIKTFVTLRL